MTRLQEWKCGVRDGLPICFGYFAVSFAFGIQAGAVGLTALEAALMSLTNVTSAGQFAALGIIAAGSSYLEMAFTQLVINLRYCLMSCALSQKLKSGTSSVHRFGIAYGVTDEIFGVSMCREKNLNPFYAYGLISIAVPGWVLGTFFGVISGSLLPQNVISALGIAIYGMFIAIIIPTAKKDKHVLYVILAAVVMSTLFYFMPFLQSISSGFQIILITLLIAGLAAWLFPRDEEEEADAD